MHQIIIQRLVSNSFVPSNVLFKHWVKIALKNKKSKAEVTIRVVDKEEMIYLNSNFRKKNKVTNVLSFPFDIPIEVTLPIPILGDIVICAEVIEAEAKAQNKTRHSHWAHMTVHGVLHLLGYDHEKEDDAKQMETEEAIILAKLGFDNPYISVEIR